MLAKRRAGELTCPGFTGDPPTPYRCYQARGPGQEDKENSLQRGKPDPDGDGSSKVEGRTIPPGEVMGNKLELARPQAHSNKRPGRGPGEPRPAWSARHESNFS